MQYKLTENTDITNTGCNSTVTIFDTFVEMQDYIMGKLGTMTIEEAENHSYNIGVEYTA